MSIHLVCGYRGVGKDTFCAKPVQIFQKGFLNGAYHQYVFASEETELPTLSEDRRGISAERISLAETLKRSTHSKLNLEIPVELWDSVKDRIFVKFEGRTQTLRSWYIEFGESLCAKDRYHFSKLALDSLDGSKDVIISDWRKLSELEYANIHSQLINSLAEKKSRVWTWRIYRSVVPLPPADALLEFDLDEVKTDFLCVQSREEFNEACKRFPQYKDYVLRGIALRTDNRNLPANVSNSSSSSFV